MYLFGCFVMLLFQYQFCKLLCVFVLSLLWVLQIPQVSFLFRFLFLSPAPPIFPPFFPARFSLLSLQLQVLVSHLSVLLVLRQMHLIIYMLLCEEKQMYCGQSYFQYIFYRNFIIMLFFKQRNVSILTVILMEC